MRLRSDRMVDRVHRWLIAEALRQGRHDLVNDPTATRQLAIVALEAIRRPTSRMLAAAREVDTIGDARAEKIWKAMFDTECRWLVPTIEDDSEKIDDVLATHSWRTEPEQGKS